MSTQRNPQLSRYMSKVNRIFGTKHSKINGLQKTIKYQTHEQITKYLNLNM